MIEASAKICETGNVAVVSLGRFIAHALYCTYYITVQVFSSNRADDCHHDGFEQQQQQQQPQHQLQLSTVRVASSQAVHGDCQLDAAVSLTAFTVLSVCSIRLLLPFRGQKCPRTVAIKCNPR